MMSSNLTDMLESAIEQPVALKTEPSLKWLRGFWSSFPVVSSVLSKHCCKCKKQRPIERFSPDPRGRYLVGSVCKNCISVENSKKWYLNHPRKPLPKEGFKFCSKCKAEKNLSDFQVNAKSKDGRRPSCKICDCKRQREVYAKDPTAKNASKQRWHEKNSSKIKKYKESWYLENKTRLNQKGKEWRQTHKEEKKAQDKLYRTNNREKVNKKSKEYRSLRYKTDPTFKLEMLLRKRIINFLNGRTKCAHSMELVGCSKEKAMEHLESQFWPEMTRENQGLGGWEVDHIIPLSSFNKTDLRWQFKTFHYTNMQPLWWDDNRTKSKRLDWSPMESTHKLPERIKKGTN
jgi:hypothetical protein